MPEDKEKKAGKDSSPDKQDRPGGEIPGGTTGGTASGTGERQAAASAPASETTKPCCCDKLRVYLQQVKCVHKTSTLGISVTDDEVAVTSLAQGETGGPTGAKWPENQRTYGLGEGDSIADDLAFLLATFSPNYHCKVDAEVAITLWRVNALYDIKETLQQVLGRAGVIGQSLTGLSSVGSTLQTLLDRLYKFSGAGEVVIGDSIRLPFHHNFGCDVALSDLLSAGVGRSAVADGNDACNLKKTLKRGDGAEYEVHLRIERECPDRPKTK